MTHCPRRAEDEAQVSCPGWGGPGGWQKEGSPAGRRPSRGSAEVLCEARGSTEGGTDTTRPRDDERDEEWKRKLTRSEPDAEGIYYNLKWE